MRGKSKFIAFILSAIPGLAHFYINLRERAIIFFMITFGVFAGSLGLYEITGRDEYILIFIFAYPIIWLVSITDMFSAWKSMELSQLYNNGNANNIPMDSLSNKKTLTLALSIIPGAGHMYLGYQTKGLIIMASFLFSVFFMGWLGISFPLFLLPLIWFYGFFDAFHMVDSSGEEIKGKDLELSGIIKPEWVGYGLIGIGVIAMIEKVLYPLIDPTIRNYIQTSIVSLLFIVAGVVILIKNKNKNGVNKTEVEDNEGK
ncbi:MAG: hypothetical protein GX066_00790 [Clostridiaceae bacterium]|nr:hypothetical protein [Clostridiaceae bacterium]